MTSTLQPSQLNSFGLLMKEPTNTKNNFVVDVSTRRSSDSNSSDDGKAKSHGKSLSLVGFDPLLESTGSGVWSGGGDGLDTGLHPLSSPTITPPTGRTPLPRHSAKKVSRGGNHRKTQSIGSSLPPTHRKTSSMDQLREIATALAIDKPLAVTAQEEQLVTSWGGSSAANHVNRHKMMHKKIPRGHRKAHSMGGTSDFVSMMMNNNEEGVIRDPANSVPSTPDRTLKKVASLRLVTPTKKIMSKNEHDSPTGADQLEIPSLTPLKGFLTGSDGLALRSSEQEPSLHQVEIPSCDEVLMHGRLCALVNQYRMVDQNFDFGALVGTSRMALQGFVLSNGGQTAGLEGLIQEHTPIIQSLLECADDVVLEGFFHESDANDTNERVEVAVFNCQARRQFVVVYRGTTMQQAKPIRSKQVRLEAKNLHLDQPVGVFPTIRDGYFNPDLEARVFALLDQLSEQYPFCDVVTTGHAFGGALATIAGLRYASSREMMRASCHIFGSPKVGGKAFKEMVNSTPNLKVVRVENGQDPKIQSPDTHAWVHVGHTIVVQPEKKLPAVAYRFDKNKPASKHFLGLSLNKKADKAAHGIDAYVFAMEQFARSGLAWVKTFAGEDGKGVRGSANEKRLVV